MKTKPSGKRQALLIVALWVLAVALGSQPAGSAFGLLQVDWLGRLTGEVAHRSTFFMAAALGATGLMAVWIYLRGLNPLADGRSRIGVLLTWLAPSALAATMIAGYDRANGGPTMLTWGAAPGVLIAPALVVWMIEAIVLATATRLFTTAHERDWRKMGIATSRLCLRIDPLDRRMQVRCGLLLANEDDYKGAIAYLEKPGPVRPGEGASRLRAMERCYRVLGRQDRAVECLETLLRMNPTSKGLANRLLEDYLALDRSQDALRLLEEMQLKDSFTRLQLRQGLYLRLGNIDKAFEMIRKLAAYEDESHALSIQLDRELLELAPQRTDVCLHLADTLMDAHSKEERFEGARLLEEVVGREPRRADLRLRLIRYYMESDRAALTQPHLETLVREGTDDPTVYLNYAQLLQRQDRQEEAAGALETMTERLPEVWRGHVRLARIRLEQDRLEAAAKSLEAAEACADEEAAPLIEHLRNDIEQLRRKRKIDNMRENIKTNENEPDSRLQLIDELIRSDRIDEALKNSEALLHERPDCLPTLQEHLEAGIRRTSMNYRLCDYMADLYSKEARYDDLLRLYRLMSEKSMEPNNVMIQGCERVLSRAPGHVDARRELAFARRMNNDWPGVLDALAPLIQSDGGAPSPLAPEDQALWVEASYREGRLDEAARVGNAIAEELASESGFMLLMIDVLRGLKDHAGAYRIYEMATKAMPDDVRLRRLARRINYERKTDRLSQLSARPGETLTPDEHFEKAELHREFGEQEQAIVHYQKAADKDTLSKPALGNMAVVMCDRGMYDLAFETLEPIELTRELETANPELKAMFYQVALAMEKHKRFDKAVTFYKRIFRVDAAYSDVVDRLQRLS